MDDEDVEQLEEAIECDECGGVVGFLGRLGLRLHYECRHCGAKFSKPVPEEELKRNKYVGRVLSPEEAVAVRKELGLEEDDGRSDPPQDP